MTSPEFPSRAYTSLLAPTMMTTVLFPLEVLTLGSIRGSRKDCIPIVLMWSLVFQSNCIPLTDSGDKSDGPRCHASRAGSALLVIHSAFDEVWLTADREKANVAMY